MIKIMLADDQQLVREALAALLGLEHDIEVVAQVGGGDEVLPAIHRYHPDVVLLDIEMPGSELSSGIDVAAAIRDAKLVALTGEPVRSLILTTFGRPGYLRRALDAGASGFMVKDTSASQLAEGIRRVNMGLTVVDPSLAADSLLHGESPLTERKPRFCGQPVTGQQPARSARRCSSPRHGAQPLIFRDGETQRLEPARSTQYCRRQRLVIATRCRGRCAPPRAG